jgi:nucleoside-diphosphate-sugar epimerase
MAAATVLVTGATGLVGFETYDQLRGAADVAVVGTSRRVPPAAPDLVPWDMGNGPHPPALARHWDAIVHTAADVRWTMEPDEAVRANVRTVEALRPLVRPDTHVVHVSTAYADGLRGNIESTDPADYRNTYEWSKAHAERVARALFERLTIVRPPLIVGRRADGRAARFAGMYTILRGIAASSVPALAADSAAVADVVPVDDLAGHLVRCARDTAAAAEPVVIAGGKRAPQVEVVVRAMLAGLNGWRAEHGHAPLEAPRIVSPDSWNRFFLPFAREHLTTRQNRILDLLRNFEPYFALTAPLIPTHEIVDVEDCVRRSAAYWARHNPLLASRDPRPWHS